MMETQNKPTKKTSIEYTKNFIKDVYNSYLDEGKTEQEAKENALICLELWAINDMLEQEYKIINQEIYEYKLLNQKDLDKIKIDLKKILK